MELRHLRYFVAVAEECHFGRAAARLHVTQSTLSTQVKALEREVGGPVFVRTSRRVELTEAGQLLLVEARRTLAQAGRALDVARQSVRGETGAVRIGFSGIAVLEGTLSTDLRRFHAAHPRVELHLTELPPAAQVQGLRDGTLDIGYSPDNGLGEVSDLAVRRGARTTLSIAVRHDHALAAEASVAPGDLEGETLIVYAADQDDESVLDRFGAEQRARVHLVTGTLGALVLASAGVGVAVVPAAAERIGLRDLVYRPLRDMAADVDVVTLSRPDEIAGAVRAFVRSCDRAAGE
ncbi:LysR substrate-binding domain-containing protein [Streptomyces sp. NBC_00006]|uniref:LysR substrate-binding domain-containing protein n=1 Tax=unclassified Streptomyces TaxID=2593676 RepID=UPI00224EA27C|nr:MULTISPECIES: LysR substrate-binding domain-containing protein [unclassified Streptomyces]MCX5535798.1 LysR substrate-binding domain-containing protein [Streptomyces sp. NBC_00006]